MRFLFATATVALVTLSSGCLAAQNSRDLTTVGISTLANRPAVVGSAETFTGTVLVDLLFAPAGPRTFGGANVTFLPGARSHWHSHPGGQTLVVTEGVGWMQTRDGERREIRAGDVVWTPPGVEHWHGATQEHAVTHLALQGAVDGEVVEWLESVTDEQYRLKAAAKN